MVVLFQILGMEDLGPDVKKSRDLKKDYIETPLTTNSPLTIRFSGKVNRDMSVIQLKVLHIED